MLGHAGSCRDMLGGHAGVMLAIHAGVKASESCWGDDAGNMLGVHGHQVPAALEEGNVGRNANQSVIPSCGMHSTGVEK